LGFLLIGGRERVEGRRAYSHDLRGSLRWLATGRSLDRLRSWLPTDIPDIHERVGQGIPSPRYNNTTQIHDVVFPSRDGHFLVSVSVSGFGLVIVVRGTGFSHWVFSTGTICIFSVVALIILGSHCLVLFYNSRVWPTLRCYPALSYEEIALDLRFEYAPRISFLTSEV
jgi:hypothetical protein